MTKGDTSAAQERFTRLHREIRRRICLLDYAPNTRLSEADLATEFGTSRTPVRRVLGRLEDEGLVQSVQGVGTFVTDYDISELEQVYQLRLELLDLMPQLSPQMPDEDWMSQMAVLSKRSKAILADPDPRAFTELDMDHFALMVQLTANQELREITERLYFKTKRIWVQSAVMSAIDLALELAIFDREIDDIIAALKIGDLSAVASIQKAHISMSFQRLKQAAA